MFELLNIGKMGVGILVCWLMTVSGVNIKYIMDIILYKTIIP
jgi:hypothetical protein